MEHRNRWSSLARAGKGALGIGCVGLLLWTASGQLRAQSFLMSGINPVGDSGTGVKLYSVTGSVGWESLVSPAGGFYLPGAAGLKGDLMMGAGAAAGWSRRTQKTSLSVRYDANYQAQIRYSQLSALNQLLTLSANRRLGGKWNFGFSATSSVSTYDQMLFSPTVFGSILAVPGTFDDLSSAVLAGKYNSDQLASLLTGSPVIESPARTLFFGNRVFNSSAATSLSYAHSQRLTVSFQLSAGRSQHLKDSMQSGVPQYVYLVPRSIHGDAGVNVSYSLTPRTQAGINMGTSRGFSQVQDAYATTVSGFIGRNMGQHWFAQAHAGGGFATYVRTQVRGSTGTSPVFGAGLGYKTYAHSFMGAYDRTLGQSYGLGAMTMVTYNVAWHWWRPGRSWGLSSNYLRQQFSGGTFGDVNGWRAAFGMTRQVGRHMMLETGYTYGTYSSRSALAPYQSAQHAVRLSVMWMPQGRERR